MPEIELQKTVEQAVSQLMTELSIHDKRKIKNTPKDSLFNLHFSFGMNIRNAFGLWSGNEELLESCLLISGKKDLHIDDASSVIINALWEKLQKYPPPKIVTKGISSKLKRSRMNEKEKKELY